MTACSAQKNVLFKAEELIVSDYWPTYDLADGVLGFVQNPEIDLVFVGENVNKIVLAGVDEGYINGGGYTFNNTKEDGFVVLESGTYGDLCFSGQNYTLINKNTLTAVTVKDINGCDQDSIEIIGNDNMKYIVSANIENPCYYNSICRDGQFSDINTITINDEVVYQFDEVLKLMCGAEDGIEGVCGGQRLAFEFVNFIPLENLIEFKIERDNDFVKNFSFNLVTKDLKEIL